MLTGAQAWMGSGAARTDAGCCHYQWWSNPLHHNLGLAHTLILPLDACFRSRMGRISFLLLSACRFFFRESQPAHPSFAGLNFEMAFSEGFCWLADTVQADPSWISFFTELDPIVQLCFLRSDALRKVHRSSGCCTDMKKKLPTSHLFSLESGISQLTESGNVRLLRSQRQFSQLLHFASSLPRCLVSTTGFLNFVLFIA